MLDHGRKGGVVMSMMRARDTIEHIKALRDELKIQGECDVEEFCDSLKMNIGEVVYLLIFLFIRKEFEAAKYRDAYYQMERKYKYMEEALDQAYQNGNRKQAALVKSGLPIAKKKSRLGELRLLMKLGNNDEDLMEWFDISRTTLWRWKKELKEWEQQGKL